MSLGDAVRRVRFQGGGDGDLPPAQFAISEDDLPPLAEGVAVQIARSAGARVLGTVSSATKAALLHEPGVEAVVYREQDWSAARRRWASNGVDIDWYLLLTRSLTLRGFRAVDYFDRYAEARRRLADLYLAGELRQQVEIVAGLEAAPEALCRMLCSGTVGKTSVALALGEVTAGAREP